MFGVSSELPIAMTTGKQTRISPGEWDLCCHHYAVIYCLVCSMEISKVSVVLVETGTLYRSSKSTSNSISNLARVCLSSSMGKLFENQKSVGSQAPTTLIQRLYCESLTSCDHAEGQSDKRAKPYLDSDCLVTLHYISELMAQRH